MQCAEAALLHPEMLGPDLRPLHINIDYINNINYIQSGLTYGLTTISNYNMGLTYGHNHYINYMA